jgi:hypothetical protein
MSYDNEAKRESRLAPILALAAMAFMPLAYVLCSGPFLWLLENDYLPEQAEYIYLPLAMLADSSTTISSALEWYTNLWQ